MNGTMRPIFNEIFGEKRDLWIPWTVYGTHKPNRNALIKKKRKKEKIKPKCRRWNADSIQTYT